MNRFTDPIENKVWFYQGYNHGRNAHIYMSVHT
uniref:Uncharacterized protein n=1 Tax=Anguilla anguilla TaxID=7936 RepID=A0A0E9QRV6_ANGAN